MIRITNRAKEKTNKPYLSHHVIVAYPVVVPATSITIQFQSWQQNIRDDKGASHHMELEVQGSRR